MAIISKTGKTPAELHAALKGRPEQSSPPAFTFPGLNPSQVESMTADLMKKKKMLPHEARRALSEACVAEAVKIRKNRTTAAKPETAVAPAAQKAETATIDTTTTGNNKPEGTGRPTMGSRITSILGISAVADKATGEGEGATDTNSEGSNATP